MKTPIRKTLLGTATLLIGLAATSAQAITVSGTANLFKGGDFTGNGLPVSYWSAGSNAVLLGSFASAGTPITITYTGGNVDFAGSASYGDSRPDGRTPTTPPYDNAPVLGPLNGGSGFRSGALIAVWSSTNNPLSISPIGSVFYLGSMHNPGDSFNLTSQAGYLFAGIADEGWSDNTGFYNLNVTPVPLPGTVWLLGSGLLGLLGYRRFQSDTTA